MYYHRMILKAFEEKDASRAKRLMRSHLQKALDDIYYDRHFKAEDNNPVDLLPNKEM